jgi:ribonuclease J
VVFSSKIIPGNERAIGRVHNLLAHLGVEIVTEDDEFVHVSGHPARDELAQLYQWVRPRLLVPIHGETRHLIHHTAFARARGIERVLMVENGTVARLGPEAPAVLDQVTSGRLAVDGARLVPVNGEVLRGRRALGYGGAAVATVVVDRKGRLVARPQLTLLGVLDVAADGATEALLADAIVEAVADLPGPTRRDDDAVSETARIALRRRLRDLLGKRPIASIHVVRV